MAGVKRNLLDWEKGFNIAVNVYIIRYMYSHMVDKAKVFMVEGSERRKSVDLYGIIGMNRQKISRMVRGARFEISQRDREMLTHKLGLGSEYFEGEGKYIALRGIDINDWKCFFEDKYDVEADKRLRARGTREERRNSVKRVNKALEDASRGEIVHKEYDTNTEVYQIYFYFKNGAVYQQETRLTTFIKALNDLRMTDWEDIEYDVEKLEAYNEKLREHLKYSSILLSYRKLKREQKEN